MHKSIVVPAEEWQRLTKACDLVRINEQTMKMKPGAEKPVSVKVEPLGAHLYTAFCVCFGSFSNLRSSYIGAYRLCPLDAYTGKTTILYHDEDAIKNGERERGDMTGLIVTHRGKSYVCQERTHILRDLPEDRLYLEVAKAHEAKLFESNALGCTRNREREEHGVVWRTCQGHPIACYGESRYLCWQNRDTIEFTSIDPSYTLDSEIELDPAVAAAHWASPVGHTPTEQLSLF
ncbi:hypothetical protein [Thalassospira sp. CH_XMU1420-2]|uniref:hypothetical protein n=1 Tax=Thalassospira sp. CH_XMU1420-2 TaxID=3107769 RepID=UPI003008DC85